MKPHPFCFCLAVILGANSVAASSPPPSAVCSDSLLGLADNLTVSRHARLEGVVRTTSQTPPCALPVLPVLPPAGSGSKVVSRFGKSSLDTSFHGAVLVRLGGQLLLKPGRYRLAKLVMEWASVLRVDTSGTGSDSTHPGIRLDVQGTVHLYDGVSTYYPGLSDSLEASRIALIVDGPQTVTIGYGAQVHLQLIAPQSSLELRDWSRFVGRFLVHQASVGRIGARFAANGVELEPTSGVVAIQGLRRFWTSATALAVAWTVDGVIQTSQTTELLPLEGPHTIRRCSEGRCDSVLALVDRTPPTVQFMAPMGGWSNQSRVELVWTVDGIAYRDSVTLLEGLNTLMRSATDSAGNTGSAAVQLLLDTQAPVVKITFPTEGSTTNKTVVPVTWSVDGIGQPTDSTSLAEGWNLIVRRATDSAGNRGADSVRVAQDTRPPVIVFLEPLDGFQTPLQQVLVRWKVDDQEFQETVSLVDGLNRVTKTAVDAAGNRASATLNIYRMEPTLPAPVAPPNPPTRNTDLSRGLEFLFGGENPIQSGFVADSTPLLKRAVLRGRVMDAAGHPIPNVQMQILNGERFGSTRTRLDGWWDLVVEGDTRWTVDYTRTGYAPSQREAFVAAGDVQVLDSVMLVPLDTVITEIVSNGAMAQVVAGSTIQDASGTRQPVLMVPSGTEIQATLPDGSIIPLTRAHLRVTEFTAGGTGLAAMPAYLPASTEYTFCAEVSADEVPGSTHLNFSRPVPFYVDNFLKLPVGWPVPVGSYDRAESRWNELPNGRILQILGNSPNGQARIDAHGNGMEESADSLSALGITAEELVVLGRYPQGTSLMRALASSFSPIDLNYPVVDSGKDPDDPPDPDDQDSGTCEESGCEIDVQNQIMREKVSIPGTDLELVYHSDRVEGRTAERAIRFRLWNGNVPSDLVAVEATVIVLGRTYTLRREAGELADTSRRQASIHWDGMDAWGRKVYGRVAATVEITNIFRARYAMGSRRSFLGSEILEWLSNVESRLAKRRTKTFKLELDAYPIEGTIANGWGLSPLHRLAGNRLLRGEGGQEDVRLSLQGRLVRVAGGGTSWFNEGKALDLAMNSVRDLATLPDGRLLIADQVGLGTNRSGVWALDPSGKIERIAGCKTVCQEYWDTIGVDSARLNPWQLTANDRGQVFLYDWTPSYARDNISVLDLRTLKLLHEGFSGYQVTDLSVSDLFGVAFTGQGQPLQKLDASGGLQSMGGGGTRPTSDLRNGTTLPISSLFADFTSLVKTRDGLGLVVFDARAGIFLKLDGSGNAQWLAGGGSTVSERGNVVLWRDLRVPSAVTAMGYRTNGSLVFVAGSRVYSLDPDGFCRILAGDGTELPQDGVSLSQVRFNSDLRMAIGPRDEIFLVEDYANVVWKIEATSTIRGTFGWVLGSNEAEVYLLDSLGRQMTTAGRDGRALRQFQYDDSSRVVAIGDSLGRWTQIVRDAQGGVREIVAPSGERTALRLDEHHRITRIDLPDGRYWEFAWQPNGLASSIRNAQGSVSQYSWDSVGRLREDRRDDGAKLTLVRDRQYGEKASQIVSRTGAIRSTEKRKLPDGSVLLIYRDEWGRQSSTRQLVSGDQIDSSSDGTLVTTTHPNGNPDRQRIVTRRPDGTQTVWERIQRREFRDASDPTSLVLQTDTTWDDGKVSVHWHDALQKIQIDLASDGRQDTAWRNERGLLIARHMGGEGKRIFGHDANGNVVRERALVQGQQAVLWEREFDAASHLLQERTAVVPGGPMVTTVEHSYDTRGWRVSSRDGRGDLSRFDYDEFGNPTAVMGPRGVVVAKRFDALGRVVTQWDAEEMRKPPSMRRAQTWNFDFEGRELSHTDKFGAETHTGYDLSGRRIWQATSRDTTRSFYNDQGQLVREIDPEGTAVLYKYDPLGNQILTIQKSSGISDQLEAGDRWTQTRYDTKVRNSAKAATRFGPFRPGFPGVLGAFGGQGN